MLEAGRGPRRDERQVASRADRGDEDDAENGLAWFEWHGAWSWLVLAVMLVEYAVTTVDSVVEDKTRERSPFERTNHMLLALNTGLCTRSPGAGRRMRVLAVARGVAPRRPGR